MAKRVTEIIIGVDVSKAQLDVYVSEQDQDQQVENTVEAIDRFLDGFHGRAVIGIEATGCYHEAFVDRAIAAGHTVYQVDGYRLSRYREGVGGRAKTDRTDARLLARYVAKERDKLRPAVPQSPAQRALWRLVKRRAKVVQARQRLGQSLRDVAEIQDGVKGVLDQLKRLVAMMERRIERAAKALGWGNDLARLRTIPGIGLLSAVALCAMYRRGQFARADQFIAFLGLDVRVRDSGVHRGRRKLTKKGDPEVRRLLFNAARSAEYRHERMSKLSEKYRARGLSTTATSVIIARKLARLGYALLRDQSSYEEPIKTA